MDKDWRNATDEEILAADLMIELDLAEMPTEDQASVLLEMSQQMEEAVLRQVLSRLYPNQRDELDALIEEKDPVAIKEYLAKTVPDYPELYTQELIRFKRIMLTGEKPNR